jgi:hypothetical protein
MNASFDDSGTPGQPRAHAEVLAGAPLTADDLRGLRAIYG